MAIHPVPLYERIKMGAAWPAHELASHLGLDPCDTRACKLVQSAKTDPRKGEDLIRLVFPNSNYVLDYQGPKAKTGFAYVCKIWRYGSRVSEFALQGVSDSGFASAIIKALASAEATQ